jgi:hypothetical protein
MTLNHTTIGQPIPLGRINGLEPGGEYQIEITVKDQIAGAELQEIVPFSIAEEATEETPEEGEQQ